jgi:hypothetical protein
MWPGIGNLLTKILYRKRGHRSAAGHRHRPESDCGLFTPPQVTSGRIINGVEASPGQFPFVAAIHGEETFYCSGVFVAPRFLLTSKVCGLRVERLLLAPGLRIYASIGSLDALPNPVPPMTPRVLTVSYTNFDEGQVSILFPGTQVPGVALLELNPATPVGPKRDPDTGTWNWNVICLPDAKINDRRPDFGREGPVMASYGGGPPPDTRADTLKFGRLEVTFCAGLDGLTTTNLCILRNGSDPGSCDMVRPLILFFKKRSIIDCFSGCSLMTGCPS